MYCSAVQRHVQCLGSASFDGLEACRSAFYPLIARYVHGFRMNGTSQLEQRGSGFFFGSDTLHPNGEAYQKMAGIAVQLYKQVRLRPLRTLFCNGYTACKCAARRAAGCHRQCAGVG